jgi:hypothetical protein
MSRKWRQRGLLGALAVTIVLSAASGEGRKSADALVVLAQNPVSKEPRQPAQPLPHIELERLQMHHEPAESDMVASTAFSAMSWYVPPPPPPPPPPPKPVPPPPPTAPPMPFSFLGRYMEGQKLTILLVRGDRMYTVAEGEVIDNTYRVERLNGEQVELTYLPLNIKQTISTGGT